MPNADGHSVVLATTATGDGIQLWIDERRIDRFDQFHLYDIYAGLVAHLVSIGAVPDDLISQSDAYVEFRSTSEDYLRVFD